MTLNKHKFEVGTNVVGLQRDYFGKLVEQWTDVVIKVHKNGNIVLRDYQHYSRKPKRWRVTPFDTAVRCDDTSGRLWIAVETPDLRAQIDKDGGDIARSREFSAIVDRLEMRARSGYSPSRRTLEHARELCDMLGLPRIDK